MLLSAVKKVTCSFGNKNTSSKRSLIVVSSGAEQLWVIITDRQHSSYIVYVHTKNVIPHY